MKYLLLTATAFVCSLGVKAQQGDGGNPYGYSYTLKKAKQIDEKVFPQPDIEALKAEDAINDKLGNGPWRFGYNNETSLDLNNSGTWFDLPSGDRIWLLKIEATNAKTVNLSFVNTQIPEGNELFVYNPDKTFILGKFQQNHIYKGELGTELVPGSEVIIEYYVPKSNILNPGNVEVSRVTHGYRTAVEFQEKAFGSSGSCNMNVNCPDGGNWVNQRNSAVMLVSGGNGFCSGALINNTLNDGTPYVLTANHCYSNPTNWVFRFQWQAQNCPNPSTSPSFQSLSGAVLRSRRTPSDFCLVEITGGLSNGTVPQTHTPYFSGWNNADVVPTSTVSIHHPSGDIKKISFDDNASQAVQAMGSTEPNSSWEVVWDRNTTTEGGSSGSPLFDQNQRIIGQLWGGGASCSNLSAPDYYGRVYNSWEPAGSSNAEQLKHWLDPNSSGVSFIDGYDPYFDPLDYDVAVNDLIGVDGIICGPAAYPKVTIRNNGAQTLTSATITYTYNNNPPQNINWTGNLTTFQSEDVNLPYFGAVNGSNDITVTVSNPNGQADQETSNNSMFSNFMAVIEGEIITMDLTLDCFADEISWSVVDANSYTWYQGGGYTNPGNTTMLVSENFCLIEGCYDLILNDSYGDGLNGSSFNGCDFDGSMQLSRATNGQLLGELTEAQSNFGNSITFPFCAQNTAGLQEINLEQEIKVFPNPNNGSFTLEMNFSGSKEIILQDLTGKIIAQQVTDNTISNFSHNKLSAGVYLLRISTFSGIITKKIIVE
ncbi:MAG: T9SS type A sorting domain-containing protein [Brumimicrobium sp.]|nr:T9SS type A sorting domain-containing protein [Brumimicrobium sp.]